MTQGFLVDVVIPARDCASALAPTIAALPMRLLRSVVVVDNGSVDATAQVARDAGAVVLREPRVGHGAACLRAVSHLEALPRPPDLVVFFSPDGSDAPADLPRLLEPIRTDSAELVIGVRPRARRSVHSARTQVALGLIGVIYRHRFEDLGPLRAIRFPALVALGLTDRGAGYNVEMQVKALKLGLRIVEVPVTSRESKKRGSKGEVMDSLRTTGRVFFQILRHATAR